VSDATFIARCPEHGLHGERQECFECGTPVEQVEVVTLGALPRGADANLRLKRDKAIAVLVLKHSLSLQEAADKLGEVLGAVDSALVARGLSRLDAPATHPHHVGPTVPGSTLMDVER
jgi:hypothetical protein